MYNLDVIISVGYRVKSVNGTRFRQWANKILKNYLIKGYAINKDITAERYNELKDMVRIMSRTISLQSCVSNDEYSGLFNVIGDYVYALDILDGYDYRNLSIVKTTSEGTFKITYENAMRAINVLKEKFGESRWFANEKDNSFKSSIGQIYQTFGGEELYPSVEEKAAMLLYLVVKNHSFNTWGSALVFHPHLHCIVPGGGKRLDDGTWKTLPQIKNGESEPFLFPVKALGKVFRAKFMAELSAIDDIPEHIRAKCFSKPWVVYAKSPVSGAESTLEYLARYAYRVAISDRRILEVSDETVTFEYKDYKDGGKNKPMTLQGCEFVRRYAQHILPYRFVHIRHYGILAPGNRKVLATLQTELNAAPVPLHRGRRKWKDIAASRGLRMGQCPSCGEGILVIVRAIPHIRSPERKPLLYAE